MNRVLRVDQGKYPIVPDTLIFQYKVYDILSVSQKFIIKKYDLFFTDQILTGLQLIEGVHPNCDPKTRMFCLSKGIKGCAFSKEVDNKLYYLLKTFNLDNSYFMPWGYCKYTRRFSNGRRSQE